jgi:16S rRNA (guanine966-N2)-methyltransferase
LSNPRIIAGKARGFRLQGVPGDVTRPITDRVKEALYNIIGADIEKANFFDLFGGTGSVGIEALSRGAAFVRFLDNNRNAFSTIKINLQHTHFSELAEVILTDTFSYLKRPPDRPFDYIYVAPPQYKELWQRVMHELNLNPGWLSQDGWIIVQIDPKELEPNKWLNFTEFDQRRYGSTILLFYKKLLNTNQRT